MKSCRSDKIEQEIVKVLAPQIEATCSKLSKVNLMREIERLKAQKLSYFQDYKEKNLSREGYIDRKQTIDKGIVGLEESLRAKDRLPLTTDKSLIKELIETYVEKVTVDCLGFFKVFYR